MKVCMMYVYYINLRTDQWEKDITSRLIPTVGPKGSVV